MSIIDIAAGFVAYSILLFIFLGICYVWGYIVCGACRFITDEVIPFIKHFVEPTKKETDDG